MCRAGGRRCRGFSSTPAGERIRKRISRAQHALAAAQAADDLDGEVRAGEALSDAKLAFDFAKRDHDLVSSGQPLSAADRYQIRANEQRGRRRASPAQVEAMTDYVAVSDRFNHCLRDPERLAADHRTRAQISEIRRVLNRSIIDEDITVYRVVPADAPAGDRAFLSTTTDPEFARSFQKQFAGRPTRIMRISVAAGSRALFMNNTFEREVLLDGGDNHPMEEWRPPAGVEGDGTRAVSTGGLT